MCYLSLGQTGISIGDLPTWIGAFAAIILAIITYRYAGLVKEQSDTMAEQGRIMHDSMIRDHLARKCDRLSKEMDRLVGPLFSKMDDRSVPYFDVVYHSHEGSSYFQEIYAFWRDIKKNIYLAPRDLRESLEIYLDARQKYRKVRADKTTPGQEIAAVEAIFDKAKEDLKLKIKIRHEELIRALEDCELNLERIEVV